MPPSEQYKKLKVAHITPYVGGVVGVVPKDFILLSRDFENYLLCLDRCKTNFFDFTEVRFSTQGLMYKSTNLIDRICCLIFWWH